MGGGSGYGFALLRFRGRNRRSQCRHFGLGRSLVCCSRACRHSRRRIIVRDYASAVSLTSSCLLATFCLQVLEPVSFTP